MESEEAKRVLDALARKFGGAFMARSNNSRMYALKVAYGHERHVHKPRTLLYTYSGKGVAKGFDCVLSRSSKWSMLAETLVGRVIKFPDGTSLVVKSLEQLAVDLEIGGWL